MLFFAVLCSLVILSEQCCYPPEWEADEYVLTASKPVGKTDTILTRAQQKFAWDAPLRRYYYKGSTTNRATSTITNYKGLADYISNVMYNVIDDKCTVTAIKQSFDDIRCIPKNATKSSPVTLGLGELQITQYNYNTNNHTYFYNVASDGCVLISFTFLDLSNDARTYTSGTFENLTVGIKDKSIFNIPEECRGTSLNTIG